MSYVLHPLPKSDFLFGHPNDEDANRDILEMTIEVSELTTELVNKELLMFRQYQVEMDITPILQWWGKHDQCFSWLDFFLSNFRHFGVEKDPLVGILTNLRKCCSQNKQFLIIIFVTKNLPNECISSSNLVELIEIDIDLKKS